VNPKLKKLISSFKDNRLDAFLVTKDINIRYLVDFPASESWLLVFPKKIFYLTDFRYVLEAKEGLKSVTVHRYKKSFGDSILSLAFSSRVRRIGFDSRHLSLASYQKLQKIFKERIKLIDTPGIIENQREIKSQHEIKQIRKALKLNLEAYGFLKSVIKPGVSERQVLRRLEAFVKSRNAEFSFPPIIASGPNSCYPHAHVTDRKIRNNEPVLVDMGMDTGGFKSDLTRIFFLGKIARPVAKVSQFVKAAQEKAIQKIKPGVRASAIDYQARNYLSKRGLGKFFGHSLGHGVGLEIHEGPSISEKSPVVLKEGMVFTVEPAVYLPGKFGIRIEDMVLVTKTGCQVLSRHPKFDQTLPPST